MFYNILSVLSISVIVNYLPLVACVTEAELYSEIDRSILQRSKRQLLFPNSTLLQFNAGIGTPSLAKDVNVNYAFQANFQLPWNRTQIPLDILEANSGYDGSSRKKRAIELKIREESDYVDDAKLYHFYKYIEDMLNGNGYNGTACVLRTLCQLGAEPLHTDDGEDLLHELATFVLDPTNDIDSQYSASSVAHPYIEAFRHGQRSEDCILLYTNCTLDLIGIFSNLQSVP